MPSPDSVLKGLDPVVRKVLTETGALLTGHFALASGKHSAAYVQTMRLLQHPRHAAMVSQAAAKHFENRRVDATFAPAVGGIPWGYALAQRFHDCRAVFAERVEGKFALRRGFALQPGEQVLLAEDVITTGGSVSELIALVEDAGAEVMGFAAVVDRSGGRFKPPIDLFSWVQLMLETWEPGDCPLCREGSAAEKPGSAGVKASRR